MLNVILSVVPLHFAVVTVIILDWLKYRKFPPVVDGLIFSLVVAQFIVVSQACGLWLNFNGVERIVFSAITYTIAWVIVPTTKRGKE